MCTLSVHQKTLDATSYIISNAIPSPTLLLSYELCEIFTASEEESIKREECSNGAQSGTRFLIQLLRNKSETAFATFLRLLNDPSLQLQSLHTALAEEYRKRTISSKTSTNNKGKSYITRLYMLRDVLWISVIAK